MTFLLIMLLPLLLLLLLVLLLFLFFLSLLFCYSLHEKCTYSESFMSVFSRIRTKYGEILSISPYSFRMQENADQETPNTDTFHAVIISTLTIIIIFIINFVAFFTVIQRSKDSVLRLDNLMLSRHRTTLPAENVLRLSMFIFFICLNIWKPSDAIRSLITRNSKHAVLKLSHHCIVWASNCVIVLYKICEAKSFHCFTKNISEWCDRVGLKVNGTVNKWNPHELMVYKRMKKNLLKNIETRSSRTASVCVLCSKL